MVVMAGCPWEEVTLTAEEVWGGGGVCPHHALQHRRPSPPQLIAPVPLTVLAGTHTRSPATAALLADIGGGDRVRAMTTRFYAYFHSDTHLQQFRFEADGPAAHGTRLGDWIVEKMGGEGEPWAKSGRTGMRQPSHSRAWHSSARQTAARGRRFKLDDCVVWMR